MSETHNSAGTLDVAIVIPAKNEAGNLVGLIDELAAVLSGRTFEIIVVNDGSTDDTAAKIGALMQKYAWLRLISHRESCGKSAGLRTGALAARSPLIVTVDGDGQNDPKYLKAMLGTLEAGQPRMGLVAGQRLSREDGGFKKLQSKIANAVRGGMLRDGTRDSGCGFKAFRRDVFLSLPIFDGLHRFLPALVRREGYDIGYVDVVDRDRQAGVSHYGFWDRLAVGIPDLFGVWWLIMRRRRVPDAQEVKDAG